MSVCAFLVLCSCQEKGAVEKAGERADEIVDNVKHGEPPLKKKGPIEKIGQSIDETLERAGERK